MNQRNKAIVQVIFVIVIWGSSFSITRSVMGRLPPFFFAFMRFSVATLSLLFYWFLQRRKITWPDKLPWFTLFCMGLTGVTFFYIFFNWSLLYTNASTGAMLQGFIPACIVLLAVIFLGEKISVRQLLGIIVSLVGVVLVSSGSVPAAIGDRPLLGNFLMIVSVISWAIYTILSRKTAQIHPLIVTSIISVIGTVLLIPAVLVESRGQVWPVMSGMDWLSTLYLGILASAIGYFLYNRALEHLTASQVGIFLNLDPVVGAVIAVVVLKESIGLWQIAGVVLILGGVWWSSFRSRDEGAIS